MLVTEPWRRFPWSVASHFSESPLHPSPSSCSLMKKHTFLALILNESKWWFKLILFLKVYHSKELWNGNLHFYYGTCGSKGERQGAAATAAPIMGDAAAGIGEAAIALLDVGVGVGRPELVAFIKVTPLYINENIGRYLTAVMNYLKIFL